MPKEAAARIIAQGQTVAQATVDVQSSQADVAEAQRQVRMQEGIAEEKIRSAELQAQLAVEANATAAQMDVTLQRQAAEADIAQRNVEVRSKQTELEQKWQLAQECLQGGRTNLEAGRLHSQQLAKAECERVRAEAQAEIEKTLQIAARAETAALQRAEAAEDAMKRALQEAESQKEIRLKEKERRDWEVAFQIAASQQTQSFPRELAPAPGDRSLAPVRGDMPIAQAPGDGSQSNRVLPFVVALGDGSQAQRSAPEFPDIHVIATSSSEKDAIREMVAEMRALKDEVRELKADRQSAHEASPSPSVRKNIFFDSSDEEPEHFTAREHSHHSSKTSEKSAMKVRAPRIPPGSPDDPLVATLVAGGRHKKELDEVKGIKPWPSLPGHAEWRRNTRYVVSAASATPQAALQWLCEAEGWQHDVGKLPVLPEWETLGAKLGKALRAILKGDFLREVANMEEKILRKHGMLLDGRMLYAMIDQSFERDARLARPQALQELQRLRVEPGKGGLRTFLARWDAAVETLVQFGGHSAQDDDCLYVAFKEQFLRCEELKDHISKIKRSRASSSVHTYEWMYEAARATVDNQRLQTQEQERKDALLPRALDPLTPGFHQGRDKKKGKGKGDGKPSQRDTKNEACPRLVGTDKCSFGDERCWYSHDKDKIKAAKAKAAIASGDRTAKAKQDPKAKPCRYFKKGTCKDGENCSFLHGNGPAAAATQNGAGVVAVAVGVVALNSEVTQEIALPGLEEVDVEHIKRNHYPPEPSKCPLCRETYLKEAPAKKSGRKDVDVRIVAKEFGDVIDMDTLHMTRNNDGKIVEVEQSHPSAKMGVVMHDLATDDVVCQPVQDRTWRRVRDGLMMFGGPAGTLKKCVSDRAPEFKKALLDLMIAPFGTTPGRSTSHSRAERANRTVLEVV